MDLNHLKTYHNIVSDQLTSFDKKVKQLLSLGLQVLNAEVGVVSRVVNDFYTIVFVSPNAYKLQAGTRLDVANTLCTFTLKNNDITYLTAADAPSDINHFNITSLKPETYIGAPIYNGQETYGTINFISSTPRTTPFNDDDIEIITLIARWIGAELQRNRTYQILYSKNQLLERLEEVAKIGTWELDLVSEELKWSRYTKVIHEVPANYLPQLAMAINYYKQGKSQKTIIAAIEQAKAGGKPFSVEAQLITAKNNTIWVAAKGQADFIDGQCVRLFGTIQDVTESVAQRLELEKQKQAAQHLLGQRTKLFAKVSHELRTPLNGVIGMLTAALDMDDADARNEKLTVALRCGDLLLDIINEVLDYSKLTHGDMGLEPSEFQLNQIFLDLVSLYAPLCDTKPVKLTHKLLIEDDLWVHFDSTRLRQIVANLLNNAVKFTETGTVKLWVSATRDNDICKLIIKVADTGVGMSSETLNGLFEPFSQGPKGTAQQYGGTGLGLSIVKELITLMEGTIDVKSDIDRGSMFTVSLSVPLAQSQPQTENTTIESLVDASALNILVVDDNEINRLVMDALLQEFNAQPDFAVDGENAVYKCRSKSYDVIFMDCFMPVMDGFEATRTLKSKAIVGKHCKIIALTANTSDADKRACKAAGMDMFLSKPVKIEAIQKVLERII
ncbi:GAF domain-containing hybrid sensor histidine kinase/response regulator [Alteromonas gilva]|uniref:histidine kinase n=1 Tax=Alteromonas gilva TaxID=2987522 RepID=A0ABT5L252_9ALTE|nr:ATP-binding protein [Alteromonas gilva]MDC8831125.1 ATP-binding protein [Alteromonas gilva]